MKEKHGIGGSTGASTRFVASRHDSWLGIATLRKTDQATVVSVYPTPRNQHQLHLLHAYLASNITGSSNNLSTN